ncbi:MAG: sulfite exporter TauE/SafE family protein, partial [Deltaproteobacteria bacterium]|nr:sulfite exporter TauE/SafE family protein [Deltaproteobacteria bacterium]
AMGVIDISKDTGAILDTIGVWIFFIVIAGFAIWVIGTFLMNIGKLKGKEAYK